MCLRDFFSAALLPIVVVGVAAAAVILYVLRCHTISLSFCNFISCDKSVLPLAN